jgi:probable rRNA maturation factor
VSVAVDVIVEDERWPAALPQIQDLARRAVAAALAEVHAAPAGPVEVAILLADDEAIRALNRAWRGQDKATNVLSFPAPAGSRPDGSRLLGDIALAYETVAREAAAEGKPLNDHATHLMVHGALHLLGLDHQAEGEAEAMEAIEIAALARLGVADPYSDRAA